MKIILSVNPNCVHMQRLVVQTEALKFNKSNVEKTRRKTRLNYDLNPGHSWC
jgi:hypothetical protein